MRILSHVFGRRPPAAPRFPFLRRFLLERCRNRDEVERIFARKAVHPVEEAMIRWGRESILTLLERFPDIEPGRAERAAEHRADLEAREFPDGLPTAFSLWSPLVEWELDARLREIRLVFETFVVDEATAKFDFARKRLETVTLTAAGL
jgi:hypothetical protein